MNPLACLRYFSFDQLYLEGGGNRSVDTALDHSSAPNKSIAKRRSPFALPSHSKYSFRVDPKIQPTAKRVCDSKTVATVALTGSQRL